MKRASYREAINWIVENDDPEWLNPSEDGRINPTVSVFLIADIFEVQIARIVQDTRHRIDKISKKHPSVAK